MRNEVLGRLMRFLEPYSTRANLIVRLNREWDRAVEQFAAAEAELRAAADAGAAPEPLLNHPALCRRPGIAVRCRKACLRQQRLGPARSPLAVRGTSGCCWAARLVPRLWSPHVEHQRSGARTLFAFFCRIC
jgi:hypothetical protein